MPFSEEEIKIIFSNIEMIRNFNQSLLDAFAQRMGVWSPEQVIGDIFLQMVRVWH